MCASVVRRILTMYVYTVHIYMYILQVQRSLISPTSQSMYMYMYHVANFCTVWAHCNQQLFSILRDHRVHVYMYIARLLHMGSTNLFCSVQLDCWHMQTFTVL